MCFCLTVFLIVCMDTHTYKYAIDIPTIKFCGPSFRYRGATFLLVFFLSPSISITPRRETPIGYTTHLSYWAYLIENFNTFQNNEKCLCFCSLWALSIAVVFATYNLKITYKVFCIRTPTKT